MKCVYACTSSHAAVEACVCMDLVTMEIRVGRKDGVWARAGTEPRLIGCAPVAQNPRSHERDPHRYARQTADATSVQPRRAACTFGKLKAREQSSSSVFTTMQSLCSRESPLPRLQAHSSPSSLATSIHAAGPP
jgi:hypothetical protein